MTVETALPIVNARYLKNRTASGRLTLSRMQAAVDYIGYGHVFENPQRIQRGQWHGPDGEAEHADVAQWADAQAASHRYTYTFILSLRDGVMQDADFLDALHALNADPSSSFTPDWRMMVHRDSDHQHAHLLLFRDRTLRKAELAQWRQQLQHGLSVREASRLLAAQQTQQQQL